MQTEDVNPERDPTNAERVLWVEEEQPAMEEMQIKSLRFLRLFGKPSHARFMTDIQPGHYQVVMYGYFRFNRDISPGSLERIEEEGMGTMRVSIGTIRNQREFRKSKFPETAETSGPLFGDALPCQLLDNMATKSFPIPTGDIVYQLNWDHLVKVDGNRDDLVDIGLVIQWSGVKEFSNNSPDPVVEFSVCGLQ